MGKTKKKHHIEKPDAYDIVSHAKKRGRPVKVAEQPEPEQRLETQSEEDQIPLEGTVEGSGRPPEIESDSEIMDEHETEQIMQRAEKRKTEITEQLESDVDGQQWTASDPVIPEDLQAKVWVAVFKCPEGHKTKATNRQHNSGILCWKCRELGKSVKAEMMPQFKNAPEPPSDDLEKRRKARKAAE